MKVGFPPAKVRTYYAFASAVPAPKGNPMTQHAMGVCAFFIVSS